MKVRNILTFVFLILSFCYINTVYAESNTPYSNTLWGTSLFHFFKKDLFKEQGLIVQKEDGYYLVDIYGENQNGEELIEEIPKYEIDGVRFFETKLAYNGLNRPLKHNNELDKYALVSEDDLKIGWFYSNGDFFDVSQLFLDSDKSQDETFYTFNRPYFLDSYFYFYAEDGGNNQLYRLPEDNPSVHTIEAVDQYKEGLFSIQQNNEETSYTLQIPGIDTIVTFDDIVAILDNGDLILDFGQLYVLTPPIIDDKPENVRLLSPKELGSGKFIALTPEKDKVLYGVGSFGSYNQLYSISIDDGEVELVNDNFNYAKYIDFNLPLRWNP